MSDVPPTSEEESEDDAQDEDDSDDAKGAGGEDVDAFVKERRKHGKAHPSKNAKQESVAVEDNAAEAEVTNNLIPKPKEKGKKVKSGTPRSASSVSATPVASYSSVTLSKGTTCPTWHDRR
ncbi:hypothetical protein LXA43DRAFT_1063520 [Ganoderma leucocontextum]|nr:hypothetical protein LXA43DRAFT_1063520 [Ganoderma leucocontextum]